MMKELFYLLLTLFGFTAAVQADSPNIILILTDDQGWSQRSGLMDPENPESRSSYLHTPAMDRIAEEGMRFTGGYSPAPLCNPTRFGKSDRDKSGTLNLKEFESRLKGIKWYRISRKTPAQWHAEFDANSDGALNKKEFIAFLGSTAHIATFLKRADKDKSGGISVEELGGFIDSILKE